MRPLFGRHGKRERLRMGFGLCADGHSVDQRAEDGDVLGHVGV